MGSVQNPGAVLASTITAAAALGFVPVAVHFDLFSVLAEIGPAADVATITNASNSRRTEEDRLRSPLCQLLTADTMFAMAGLGLVDLVEDGVYRANSVTYHINSVPSAIHGMMHFTTEPLFAAAFLMRKLTESNFAYPFKEKDAAFQYGYRLLGEEKYAKEDFYTTLHLQGRLPSFNVFMEGKFGKFGTMPERVKGFGYDLESVLKAEPNDVAVVDIGGGRGEMLLEVKEGFPNLGKSQLVLQDYHPEIDEASEITAMHWDFKTEDAQPIKGALVYSLTHIYHNQTDLDAIQLMRKVADAMEPRSRMLIHEFSKNANYGKMHATMIGLFGGRIRSSKEWHQMADICGLQVTFEAYPPLGEGLVEMRKISKD